MTFFLFVAAFALGWAAITGSVTLPNLLLGGFLGAVALALFTDRRKRPAVLMRLRRAASLTWLFIYELNLSAIKVAILVLRPDMMAKIAPAIVAYPLKVRSDAEITMLANLITLTPGTLSVDVSADRKLLFVHALDCRDRGELIRSIAEGFEKKVIEVFQ